MILDADGADGPFQATHQIEAGDKVEPHVQEEAEEHSYEEGHDLAIGECRCEYTHGGEARREEEQPQV